MLCVIAAPAVLYWSETQNRGNKHVNRIQAAEYEILKMREGSHTYRIR
jgi:hypothetical protein